MFAPKELVVYPAQGVGEVERIDRQEVGGVTAEFYIVRILSNNVTLMVPVKNAINVGLRNLCSLEKADEILASLEDRSGFTGYTGQNWNRRYREYSEKLKSADLNDVAYVLRELLLIGRDKELSFGERRLLEQAMSLLVIELSFVLERSQEEVRAQIESMFQDVLQAQENKA
ncbi:MAG: CarD family transcriptional regulator [Pseudomonadota bacterium]